MKPASLFRSYSTVALLCSLTLALTPICWSQNTFFLSVEGVQGESTLNGHANEIDATGFSFAVQNSSGASPVFEDLSVSKSLDKASPLLMLHCAQGTLIPSVVLTIRSASGHDYYKVNLTGAKVTQVKTGGGVGNNPTETVTFTYQRIEIIYRLRNPDGSLGAPVCFCWDRSTGTACCPPGS